MSDQTGGYNPPPGYQPQGGYPQQPGYGAPQGGYPQQQAGWGQPPGYGQQPGYGALQQKPAGGPKFDLQSIMPGGAIAVASGALLFIISFFHWWVPNVGTICKDFPAGESACRTLYHTDEGVNAWGRGITTFALLLALAIALVFVVKALHLLPAALPVELISAALLVLADIFFLITFVSKSGIKGAPGDYVARGWALYLGLLLVLALNAGVILALMNSGGLNTLKGGLAKIQAKQDSSTGYGQQPQQWGQSQQWGQPQQQWGQPQPPPQQWGQPAPGAQPGGWPTGPASGSQPYPSGPQPQTGPQSGGQPAQPSWGQPEQPQPGGWPQQQEPPQPGWGQPRPEEQPPPQPGWGQPPQEPPQQQGEWPPQPPQQSGWPQ